MSSSRQTTLQERINNTKTNEILHLIPGEYAGPIVINKPIILVGKNSTIWALEGPVITINADAMLENLCVEVTGEVTAEATSPQETAVSVSSGNDVSFDDVAVRGNVVGVLSEEGVWRYPRSVNLGQLKSKYQHEFIMKIVVPVPSTLVCSGITGLHVEYEELKEGINDVKFILDEVFSNTFIYGNIYIKTALFKRYITICASISDNGATVNGTIAWQPNDILEINQIEEKEEEFIELQPIISAQKISSVLESNVDASSVFTEQGNEIQDTEDSVEDDFIGYAGEVKTQSTKVIPINVKIDDIEQQESEMQLNMTLGKMNSFFMANDANEKDDQNEISTFDSNPIKVASRRIINSNVKLTELFTGKPQESSSANAEKANDGSIMSSSQITTPINCATVPMKSHKPSKVTLKSHSSLAIGKAFGGDESDKNSSLSAYKEAFSTVQTKKEFDKKLQKRIKGNNFVNPNLWTEK